MDDDRARRRLESRIAEWSVELAKVERERAAMKWLPVLAVPVAGVLGLLVSWIAAVATIGVGLLAWGLGLYMTGVRRWEFGRELAEAESALRSIGAADQGERR
ncbi:MAG: hypothetical protein RI967_1542 [Planctomycetota bacterium]|jgi:hypothetical protein